MNLDEIKPVVDEETDALRAKIKADGVLVIVMIGDDFAVYGSVDPAYAGHVLPALDAAAASARLAMEERNRKAGH